MAQFQNIGLISFIYGKQDHSPLQRWVTQSVKRIAIFIMCHVSKFQKILDTDYRRIALLIYVKFSLGK